VKDENIAAAKSAEAELLARWKGAESQLVAAE
jgi:hypothetical protein